MRDGGEWGTEAGKRLVSPCHAVRQAVGKSVGVSGAWLRRARAVVSNRTPCVGPQKCRRKQAK
jgi:hypothetical protein